jgi:hypothetical protein
MALGDVPQPNDDDSTTSSKRPRSTPTWQPSGSHRLVTASCVDLTPCCCPALQADKIPLAQRTTDIVCRLHGMHLAHGDKMASQFLLTRKDALLPAASHRSSARAPPCLGVVLANLGSIRLLGGAPGSKPTAAYEPQGPIGTAEVMSPEMLSAAEVGAPADIFALGMMFAWVLHGWSCADVLPAECCPNHPARWELVDPAHCHSMQDVLFDYFKAHHDLVPKCIRGLYVEALEPCPVDRISGEDLRARLEACRVELVRQKQHWLHLQGGAASVPPSAAKIAVGAPAVGGPPPGFTRKPARAAAVSQLPCAPAHLQQARPRQAAAASGRYIAGVWCGIGFAPGVCGEGQHDASSA